MVEDTIKVDPNTVVRKSTEMARAPMKLVELNRGLNLRQQRFFNMAILAVDENGVSEFGKSEYSDIFKDDSDKFYSSNVREDINALGSLGMQYSTEKAEIWRSVFLETCYNKENGTYKFTWSPLVMEHVKNVKKNYIQQDLKILALFKNKYTFIWYDFFKSNHRQWKWQISKEELIAQLRLEDKKSYLRNHTMLYKHCIELPLHELNEFTEYNVTCKILKKGSQIIGYEFLRYTEKTVELGVSEAQINVLKEIVDRYGDSPTIMREIAKFATYDADSVPYLMDLFFEIQNFKKFITLADSYTADSFKEIVALAIKKDNQFKMKLRELYDLKASKPTIYEFIEDKNDDNVQSKKVGFYNWLEERE